MLIKAKSGVDAGSIGESLDPDIHRRGIFNAEEHKIRQEQTKC